jgi:hypothetical protein
MAIDDGFIVGSQGSQKGALAGSVATNKGAKLSGLQM